MLGPRQVAQGASFYAFSIEGHVPQDHLLRSIDRFVDLTGIRQHLAPFYSNTGRPSIDPELLIRNRCRNAHGEACLCGKPQYRHARTEPGTILALRQHVVQ